MNPNNIRFKSVKFVILELVEKHIFYTFQNNTAEVG